MGSCGYIEEEIPHIASLMCEDVDVLLAHAEVLVIGNPSEEATNVLTGIGPNHIVIDLTRGAVPLDVTGRAIHEPDAQAVAERE